MAHPVAFVVMPFDRKPTGRSEPAVPDTVDFDALWDRVYMPVLSEAGYRPVRADRDVGSLIISEMIQRLALADLVVADITLPNANVYYEIGVRHAASRIGCVLTGAAWAQPVFDLAQVRQLRFPLADGAVGKSAARTARRAVAGGLGQLSLGVSPVFASVPGFPNDVDASRLSAFEDYVNDMSGFHADVRAVDLLPADRRRARVEEIVAQYGHRPVVQETVVMRILRLLRDYVGWQAVLDYVSTLPQHLAQCPPILEQRYLALAKQADPAAAAAGLEELIRRDGGTSERFGLLGGRYKQLANAATTESDRRRFHDLAIGSYEDGMNADLNDFYPISNLPRLYRERGQDGDEQRASDAEVLTMAACQRAIRLGRTTEWTRATLLGLAFDRHDLVAIDRLTLEVEREGAALWQLTATLDDLRRTTAACAEPVLRAALETRVQRLAALVEAGGR